MNQSRNNRPFGLSLTIPVLIPLGAFLLGTMLSAPALKAQVQVFGNKAELSKMLTWRQLGPGNHSGRIVDIAVDPRNKSVYYVASASGGLWKTTDRGRTFTSVFKMKGQTSIGDIAIDPKKPDTIWLGTGEANNQRSSYHGDGIYKSLDGGKTWEHMGLSASHHIGRIVVDPRDSNHVFVAALGNLYTPNKERGLYVTRDGGKSWRACLQVDENVGVVDVAIHPKRSSIVLATSYDRRRRAWNFQNTGPGSGLWRSENGGKTFQRLTLGLPSGKIGRMGLAFAPSKPNLVYLTVENDNRRRIKRAKAGPEAAPLAQGEAGAKYEDPLLAEFFGEESEADEAPQGRRQRRSPTVGGEVYRSEDTGKTWKRMNRQPVGGSPAYYYGQIRVDPRNADKVYVLSVPLYVSTNGGKSFSRKGAPGIHVDHHALWIDPSDTNRLLLGNDGGFNESFDGGKSWVHYENLPVGQYYAITVDRNKPYRVFGGTQDNGTWCIPSRGPIAGGTRLQDCFKVSGGDGFYAVVDPEDPNIVYSESQFGGLVRTDLRQMQRRGIKPRPRKGEKPYRFNWSSPILVSPHNHTTIYFGGNKLFKSLDRGDHWAAVSQDLTTQDAEKLKGNVPHCTITTIDESPLRQGLLWVGTDDGKLWLSPDDGRSWRDLAPAMPEEARGLWVSRIVASRYKEGRAWLALTGYREDRFDPLLYVTEDYGLSFRKVSGNLPQEAVNVVREDPRNPDLIFVGTEGGAYVSTEGGGSWHPLGSNLPRVAVHDLVVHPDEGDVIVGTHGRGIWVCDVSLLESWPGADARVTTLTQPRDLKRLPRGPMGGYMSPVRQFRGDPVKNRVLLSAWMPAATKKAQIRVVSLEGKQLQSFDLPEQSGLHVLSWDLRTGSRIGNVFSRMTQAMRGRGGRRRQSFARSGTYRVELWVDGKSQGAKAFRLD